MKAALVRIASHLTGDTSNLSGDVTGLSGYVSGLSGNVSGLRGNVRECDLTDADREAGVDVSTLVKGGAS